MLDIERTRAEGEELTHAIEEILGIDLTQELATKFFGVEMGPTCLQLYQVALVYADEADRCRKAEAYFSASLMVASAIETLLALMCLMNRQQVECSSEYKKWRKKKGRTFEKNVLHGFLTDYVAVADGLNWVPSDAVDPELLQAAVQDFPLVSENLFPNDTASKVEERLSSFRAKPGIEMLLILQHMRNLIHGARWPREGMKAGSSAFQDDCKFVFVISFQVMSCIFEALGRLSRSRLADFDALRASLPPEAQAEFRRNVLELLASNSTA